MALEDYFHISRVALLALAALVFVQVFRYVSLAQRRRAMARTAGALPAPNWPQFDKVFGYDLFKENMQSIKDHTMLEAGQARFQKMGVNTFRFIALGRRMYTTIEPENLKTIQATEFKKWGLGQRRKMAFKPLLGDGIFTTDGAPWQHSREMLRPNFVRSQIGDLPTFEKHVGHLINAIPKDGSMVNLSDLFFHLTMDSATEFLFGESTLSLVEGREDTFGQSFNRGQDFIGNMSRWGKLAVFFPANKQFDYDQKFVHDFVDGYVKKGLARRNELLSDKASSEKSGRYVFLEELVRQTSDPIQIRSELLNILLAGRDTTASLLTNVWYVLSKRPDLWKKLQAEVATLDGAIPNFEQLKDLKFLKALLNESLRLHPVVPGNSREALEDTTLPLGGGPDGKSPLFIKKGEVMAWSVYTMHRRKDYYGEDAEEFKPERWLDDPETGAKGLRPGWEYLPFNGGARICLGQQFALTEASYTTLRLCQAFSGIESRDTNPWQESLMLTCVNFGGAKVSLTPAAQ